MDEVERVALERIKLAIAEAEINLGQGPAEVEPNDLRTLLALTQNRSLWQPIDTAPKDGTEIFVCVTYNLPDGEWETKRWVDSFFDGDWLRWGGMIDVPFPPTHWMPLPDLSVETSEKG